MPSPAFCQAYPPTHTQEKKCYIKTLDTLYLILKTLLQQQLQTKPKISKRGVKRL